jgi:serine/threonine protein kinase
VTHGSEDPPRSFSLLASIGSHLPDEYLAEDDEQGRVILLLLGDAEAPVVPASELRAQLHREAEILRKLRHPGCVAPIAVVELEGRVGVVTEPVDDADLDRVVHALERVGERFPCRAALDVGAQLADALRAAHTAEIDEAPHPVVHGNLKPANVRLTSGGQVRVARFGIGRVGRRARPRAATTGLVPAEAWRSPEGVLGAEQKPPGDVFAAALITAELAAGRRLGPAASRIDAHDGWSKAVAGVVEARLEGAPGAEAVVDVLRRSLAWRLEDRPSAAELANALDAASRAMPGEDLASFALRFLPRVDGIVPRTDQPVTGILIEATTPAPAPASLSRPLRWLGPARPRRPGLWIALLLPLVAASGLCGAATMFAVATWRPGLVSAPGAGPAVLEVPGATHVTVACPSGRVQTDGPTLALDAVGRGRCALAATLAGREYRGEVSIGPGVRARCTVRGGGLACAD